MTFAAYEAGYVKHLSAEDRLLKAAAACVMCLSTGRLPVFYCVDPHVPDFDRFGSEPSLRKAGCHRFTLAAALREWLSRRGIKPAIVELDPTFESARIRAASSRRGWGPPATPRAENRTTGLLQCPVPSRRSSVG